MDFFQLKCFVCVAKNKSFTEASYQLSISQSSLSKYISHIETDLHVKLFNRGKRSLDLTPAGEDFLQFAEQTLSAYHDIKRHLSRYQENGSIQIGSIENIGKIGLTGPLGSYMLKHPHIDIQIAISDTKSLMEAMMQNLYDIAFVAHIYISHGDKKDNNLAPYDLDKFDFYTIVEDEYHVIVPVSNPLARRKSLTWQTLAQEKFAILDPAYSSNMILRDAFRAFNIENNIIYEAKNVDTLLGLVDSGFALSMLSKRIVADNSKFRAIKLDTPIHRDTVIVVPKAKKSSVLLKEFLAYLLDFYKVAYIKQKTVE